MVLVFTGDGKGKTTAAFGTLLRSLGNARDVSIVQFFKNGDSSEVRFLKGLNLKNLRIKSFGSDKFINKNNIDKNDREIARKALREAKKQTQLKPFLLVLDEIFIASYFGLVKEKSIKNIIHNCREKKVHLILTGRKAPKSIKNIADLVTNMESLKHPFQKGEKPVKGIDF